MRPVKKGMKELHPAAMTRAMKAHTRMGQSSQVMMMSSTTGPLDLVGTLSTAGPSETLVESSLTGVEIPTGRDGLEDVWKDKGMRGKSKSLTKR